MRAWKCTLSHKIQQAHSSMINIIVIVLVERNIYETQHAFLFFFYCLCDLIESYHCLCVILQLSHVSYHFHVHYQTSMLRPEVFFFGEGFLVNVRFER